MREPLRRLHERLMATGVTNMHSRIEFPSPGGRTPLCLQTGRQSHCGQVVACSLCGGDDGMGNLP